MDVIDALNIRHSVRAFRSDQLDRQTLVKIIEAANRSPSWANTQPWEVFVAVGEPLERLRQAFLDRFDRRVPAQPDLPRPQEWPSALQQRMTAHINHRLATLGIDPSDEQTRRGNTRRNYEFFGAPAVAFLCLEKTPTCWSIFDMGLFAQSLMLAAQEFGVDSVPAFNLVAYPDLIRAELGVPENLMILIGVALGYADPEASTNRYRSLRRPLEEFVRFVGS